MMRIAAVDDEAHALERFERMISGVPELQLCGLFETGEALLEYLQKEPLDVVFLDIEMPEITGLELTAQIQNLNENIEIIFITAFHQYAVEAFELHAADYILKPVTQERLGKTILRLLKASRASQRALKPFIKCFGGFEVMLDEKAMPWKNSKAKEVLAYLVHKAGVPVGWEKIADAVWPDYNTEKAQANLHATTYLLRKRLAEAGIAHILQSVRGNYRIVVESIDCDAYQLDMLLKRDHSRTQEDLRLIGRLAQEGYMEGCGYDWSYGKSAEYELQCEDMLAGSR